jgi:hypothetical protein
MVGSVTSRSWRALVALSLGVLSACNNATTGGPDGAGGSADMSAGADDMAMPSDLGASGDLAGADMSVVADLSPYMIVVNAATNVLQLDACSVTPASVANLPAGTYVVTLATSTLSKGTVATTPPQPASDNYVIVQLPLPDGDPQHDRRFFMLNGIGADAGFNLPVTGTVQVMFIDSDNTGNSGDGGVTFAPGSYQTTVDAVDNVLRWRQGCNATASQIYVPPGPHTIKLVSSTLKIASGDPANYVVVRLPSEKPVDDHRYIILNGVGASYVFNANDPTPLHAWYIAATTGSTGQATLSISP